jgi:dnd system-associated protein 4
MRDRIRPPAELEESVLDRLKNDGIFETKQKGMMFAGALGEYLGGPKENSESDRPGEGIRMEYFERARDDAFIDAMAVARRGDLHILAADSAEERIEIFERNAAIGLAEMKRVCYDGGDRPLEGILGLIDRVLNAPPTLLPGLEGVDLDNLG